KVIVLFFHYTLEVFFMSRSIMKFVVCLSLIAGMAAISYAQDEGNMPHPNTKKGDAAFLFTIGGLGTFNVGGPTIGTINGITGSGFSNTPIAGVGMKFYIADEMAIRVLLAFATT